jgi:hypothetical protein
MSEGQRFAAAARRYFRIGTRTRRYRNRQDLHAEIVEAVVMAATAPGYFGPETQAALAPAHAAVCGYAKHIQGFRAAPAVCLAIGAMSPYRFIAMLADQVDAGVANMGDAERYYQQLKV